NPETRRRVLAVALRMKYQPNQHARALVTSRSYLLGMVVPDLMHSYYAEILRGVEAVARPARFQILICNTDEESAREISEVEALRYRTDGLIIASSLPPAQSQPYQRMLKDGAKIVAIDRVEGYRQALAEHGLKYDQRLVRKCGFLENQGYEAMRDWLADGNVPEAVFVANDPAAIGAMHALTEAGWRVGTDIAIAGAGCIHHGDMLSVPLTTVAWSTMEMGQQA